jgi:hypothetical protein
MILNNANNDDPYEEFECDDESPLQGRLISKPYQCKSKHQYQEWLKKAIAEADAYFKKYYPDKTVTELESYIKKVRQKFALEHTFNQVNADEYFNEHDLFLLAKLAISKGIKTDKLKECFLKQPDITMTVKNIDKAYGHTSYNFYNVLKMVEEDKSLSSFFKCESSLYVFKLLTNNMKLNGTQTRVSEFIHKLIQYRVFVIKQSDFEKLELEVKQLKEDLIVTEYSKPPFPEGAKHAWHSVALGLSSDGYKPREILPVVNRQKFMVDKSITSNQLRSFLSRYNIKMTQKKQNSHNKHI